MVHIKILKIKHKAEVPKYQTAHAAGMDLVACIDEPVIIEPHERVTIPTGFAIALPPGFEAQIRARSSMGKNYGVMPANGVGTIDADYRGQIHVVLLNTSKESFTVEPGMRIAQMVISRYETAEWVEVDELDETVRGEGGFGSTGEISGLV